MTGYAFLDGNGTILATNRRAEEIFAAADGLVSRGGRLSCVAGSDERRLQAVLAQAAETALRSGISPGSALAVRRGPLRSPYIVAVVPVSAEGQIFGRHGAATVVLISDPGHPPEVAAQLVQATFGWTHAEASVAALVVAGKRPREIARSRGVSLETVRSQLKSVFAKAGVSGQSELIRLLMGGAVALSPPRS